MSEEDHLADVVVMPKIPLDLHPCALSEGWTMDQLPEDMIVGRGAGGNIFQKTFSGMKGWKQIFFFLDRRAILDAMAWRHHDSDVNDTVPDDGFDILDVQALTERFIDLRPVPSGLLFKGGLATTWDFPGFHPIFKDTKGNVVTMSEYLHFPFLFGASIVKGPALSSQDLVAQHTTPPLLADWSIPDKTDLQKEVEVANPKIVATRERKARAAVKKKEDKKRGGDEGEGSNPKVKRRKVLVVRKDGSTTSRHVSSPEPLWTMEHTRPVVGNPSGTGARTAESREDH
ncbi:hypothetical protein Tco_0535019 [Tanacetum coccineum]